MAYIRLASAGAAERSLPIVIDELGYHAEEYSQLLILCTNGDQKYATRGGGSVYTTYYTQPVIFDGLNPDSTYGFRVEAIYEPGGRMVPIPNNGSLTYFRTLPAASKTPGMPSVRLLSVIGRRATWRITAGDDTQRVYIDRSWSTETYSTIASGDSFDWVVDLPEDGTTYSIRVRGWNSGSGHGSYSGYSYATTETQLAVGSVGEVTVTNVLTDRFTLSWNKATNALRYLVQYRVDGTSAWANITTTGLSTVITGLSEETYYQFRIRGYNGDVNGVYSTLGLVRTQSARPSKLSWPTFYSNVDINLTAKNWNDMTSKINAWLIYQGKNTRTMATAYTGNDITTAMYNDIVDRLEELKTPGTIPQKVARLDDITASKINAIGNAIDSL